jgi:hypothetical protein
MYLSRRRKHNETIKTTLWFQSRLSDIRRHIGITPARYENNEALVGSSNVCFSLSPQKIFERQKEKAIIFLWRRKKNGERKNETSERVRESQ